MSHWEFSLPLLPSPSLVWTGHINNLYSHFLLDFIYSFTAFTYIQILHIILHGGNMADKIKKLTFNIPEEIHRNLKILAAVTGQTMTEILIDCVERKYAEYEKKQKK